ncbi:MAG: nucleotide sugar dehydrogenase [Thermoproteota archaeon]|nr:nucleotide sugar dehydrogenase [Thermoproteota archaeon]
MASTSVSVPVRDLNLIQQIKDGSLKIAIYGLGHVGSPLAAAWLRAGARVIGIDKSQKVLRAAMEGRTLIPEPGIAETYSDALKTGRFVLFDDPIEASKKSYFKMICVPVLSKDMSADLSAVGEVALSIGKGLKKGDIISLNPSVPPGTTEDLIIPSIERASGLSVKRDFCMIYNPERIYEGRALQDIEENYPAIIASVGPDSQKISQTLYSMIFRKGILRISNIRTAEVEKLFEGVYRDVNIALANEMARLCETADIDFWEARDAANSQPFCHIHKPGIGVGGACIPVYPQFILDLGRRLKVPCDITRMSRIINDSMPSYCVSRALQLSEKTDPSKLNVTILGLAFRGEVSDTRLSPTYALVDELRKRGVDRIIIHDPLVMEDPNLNSDVILTSDLEESLKDSDLVILAADHPEYQKLGRDQLGNISFYDGRGIMNRKEIIGLHYSAIGFRNGIKD